jgi:hypothetical protein
MSDGAASGRLITKQLKLKLVFNGNVNST